MREVTEHDINGKCYLYRDVVLRPVADPHPKFPDALDIWIGGEHFTADNLEDARQIVDEVIALTAEA